MSNGKKFVIAGSGALAPLIVNLAVIDLQSLAIFGFTLLFVVSYLIRQTVLFGIGGAFGCLNQEENPWKLFQIGIAAPALLTAMINARQVGLPQVQGRSQASAVSVLENAIIPSALADETEPDGTKVFSLPQESPTQQISRGLFGSTPTNVWYVIAGSFASKANAQSQAAIVRQKGFSAEVYNPYGHSELYAVVIGAQLTYSDAQSLRREAISKGLASDTYLWTFPTN